MRKPSDDGMQDTRTERQAIYVSPGVFEAVSTQRGAWFETEEEIEQGLAWGERKRVLLVWIRDTMATRLTECERRYLERYYFDRMTYAQIAEELGVVRSTVWRGVVRALRKLHAAAAGAGMTSQQSVGLDGLNEESGADDRE